MSHHLIDSLPLSDRLQLHRNVQAAINVLGRKNLADDAKKRDRDDGGGAVRLKRSVRRRLEHMRRRRSSASSSSGDESESSSNSDEDEHGRVWRDGFWLPTKASEKNDLRGVGLRMPEGIPVVPQQGALVVAAPAAAPAPAPAAMPLSVQISPVFYSGGGGLPVDLTNVPQKQQPVGVQDAVPAPAAAAVGARQQQLQDASAQAVQSAARVRQLENEVEDLHLQQRLAGLKGGGNAADKQQIAKLSAELAAARAQHEAEKADYIAKVAASHKELNERVTKLHRELQEARQVNPQADRAKIALLEAGLERWKTTYTAAVQRFRKAQDGMVQLTKALETANAKNADLEARLAVRNDAAVGGAVSAAEVVKLQRQLADITEQKQRVGGLYSVAQKEVAEHAKKVGVLSAEVARLQQELARMKEQQHRYEEEDVEDEEEDDFHSLASVDEAELQGALEQMKYGGQQQQQQQAAAPAAAGPAAQKPVQAPKKTAKELAECKDRVDKLLSGVLTVWPIKLQTTYVTEQRGVSFDDIDNLFRELGKVIRSPDVLYFTQLENITTAPMLLVEFVNWVARLMSGACIMWAVHNGKTVRAFQETWFEWCDVHIPCYGRIASSSGVVRDRNTAGVYDLVDRVTWCFASTESTNDLVLSDTPAGREFLKTLSGYVREQDKALAKYSAPKKKDQGPVRDGIAFSASLA